MIFFDEPTHTYRLDNPDTGELCISATTFIGLFKSKYDSEFWSYYTGLRYALKMEKSEFSKRLIVKHRYSFKDVKVKSTNENKSDIELIGYKEGISPATITHYQNIVKTEWKTKNVKSQVKGTGFHNFKEGEIYNDGGKQYEGTFTTVLTESTDLSKLHNPEKVTIIPELRMYNRDHKVSGSADEVYVFPTWRVDIGDWKTNEKIDMSNKWDKMLDPISHLECCNYNHYSLQLSLYGWMLEQWGYKVGVLKFTHVDINERNEILDKVEYHCRYMKPEIESMLRYYKINKEQLLKKLK